MSLPSPPPGPPGPPAISQTDRNWASAAHWSAFVAAWVALAFLGPLIVLVVRGGQSPYVRAHAVEALNFHLSFLLYAVVAGISLLVLIGFVLLPLVGLLWLIFSIIGTVKATRDELYRYPLTIRFVS
jgi:uncharacterized protein